MQRKKKEDRKKWYEVHRKGKKERRIGEKMEMISSRKKEKGINK